MNVYNLLIVVNSASHAHTSGFTQRYYVNSKRVTRSLYVSVEDDSIRLDSFKTTIKGSVVRHYKTVYTA